MLPSFTPPFAPPQTVPGDPKANMPGVAPQQQQGFGFPQGAHGFNPPPMQQAPQQRPSPYPAAPGFGFRAPQGGFGNMQNRPTSVLQTPQMLDQQPQVFASGGHVQGSAQRVQQYGRGNDTMLMHVTPGEVQGLQALAQQHGGSLTTNPHTGLPEAGFLESILPMLAGGALTFLSGGALTPLMSAALVGGGTGLATGDLGKGLMAGLGAFGGAGVGSALGSAGSAANAVLPTTVPELTTTGIAGAVPASATAAPAALLPGAPVPASLLANTNAFTPAATAAQAASAPAQVAASQVAAQAPAAAQPGMLQELLGQQTGDSVTKFGRDFAQAVSGGDKISPMRTGLAALGASAPVLQALQPAYKPYKEKDDWNYAGPYTPTARTPRFRGPNANFGDSSEFSYFDNTNPYPGYEPAPKYADGGEVTAPPVDRAVRMAPAGYQAGMGAEHNFNFQPVNPAPGMQPVQSGAKTAGHGSFADLIAAAKNKGKSTEADAMHTQGMRRFRYDPHTQSVVDDGSYSDTSGAGGSGALGGPSLFSSGVNIDALKNLSFAGGGDVNLRDGSFVVDARTVSELGNGSSGAGQELLARHGGQPISGPGDGVSDSIPANIGGRQRAKVARDEVKFDPEAVRRIGGGNPQRGAQKLYALMEKAQKARKAAGRGQDTKLRKALSK